VFSLTLSQQTCPNHFCLFFPSIFSIKIFLNQNFSRFSLFPAAAAAAGASLRTIYRS
jgi:hypothetical protein